MAVHGLAGKYFPTWAPEPGESLLDLLHTSIQQSLGRWTDLTIIKHEYEVKDVFMDADHSTGIRKLALGLLETVHQYSVNTLQRSD